MAEYQDEKIGGSMNPLRERNLYCMQSLRRLVLFSQEAWY